MPASRRKCTMKTIISCVRLVGGIEMFILVCPFAFYFNHSKRKTKVKTKNEIEWKRKKKNNKRKISFRISDMRSESDIISGVYTINIAKEHLLRATRLNFYEFKKKCATLDSFNYSLITHSIYSHYTYFNQTIT